MVLIEYSHILPVVKTWRDNVIGEREELRAVSL